MPIPTPTHNRIAKRGGARGFVLPLALWIIAAAGLAAATLSEWVAQAVNNAKIVQDRVDAEIAFADIRNELVFALARRPTTFRGLQVGEMSAPVIRSALDDVLNEDIMSDRLIFFDGRPYVVSSNDRYVIKAQDGRGLTNLNTVNSQYLGRFFSNLGVREDSIARLTDTLLDYRDEDDLSRLSGAESQDYERIGLYPPANFQLLTPWEAQRIMGWADLEELWSFQYETPAITTCRASGFNPNTAPDHVLSTFLDGVSLERARTMIAQREQNPFRNIRELGDAAGIIIINQPFFFSFIPGRCLLIDMIDRETLQRIRFSLTLLPRNASQPWQIDYVIRIPQDYQRAIDQLDPGNVFPSPEEISRNQ